jgi:hypothetical protein
MPNFRNQATGSITTNGQSIGLEWRECVNGGIGLQITGTFTGTLQCQMSIDGTNYRPVNMRLCSNDVPANDLTAVGIWYANVIGARNVRVIATAAMTGTAVVTLVGLPG